MLVWIFQTFVASQNIHLAVTKVFKKLKSTVICVIEDTFLLEDAPNLQP